MKPEQDTTVYCAKCGMPVVRDWAGWTHKLPPMSTRDRRRYRHVVTVLRFGREGES